MTVCPGYVRTAFQDHVIAGNPPTSIRRARRFAIDAGECAEAIASGVERNARTIVTPRVGWLIIALQPLMPRLMDVQLQRMLQRFERE
jgi:short-subunit dehydrogenase